MFWILDGYFLRQERLYRKLYDAVRMRSGGESDYSMDTGAFQTEVSSWLGVMFSPILVVFYVTLMATVVIATYLVFHAFG